MCEFKDKEGNCNAPIPFKCGDECAIAKLEAEIKDLEDLASFKTKVIDELTEERNYYKRQMEFVLEQKEKLEKQLNITD